MTFDSGGISIKPSSRMHEMKMDMSGGAAVIEAVAAIAELGLAVDVLAVVPSTENMPSGHALKPGDIITQHNGRTVEIINTDAEGRLILADALSWCARAGRRPHRRPGDADGRGADGAGLDLRRAWSPTTTPGPSASPRPASARASWRGGCRCTPSTRT